MYYFDIQIVFQEVPGEISICFNICGCSVGCSGCHSPYLWNEKKGEKLTKKLYETTLDRYKNFASTVLFMGGEWHCTELESFLKYAQKQGYKTCLYSGEETIGSSLLQHLSWVKIGKWERNLGGLDSPKTNQKFIEVKSNKILNNLFIKS